MVARPPELDGLDTLGVVGPTLALADQIETAAEGVGEIAGLPAHEDIEQVVLLGAGDAGVAAEFVASVGDPFGSVPCIVVEGYSAPTFVSEATLCIALSRSGETEETLEAAEAAAIAGARMVVIGGGGRLVELGRSWQAPVIEIDPALPTERAALGALAIPPMLVLEQTGLWPGASDWIARTVEQLRRREAELSKPDSAAATLARTIGRTMPIIYGAGDIGGAAARRWKSQCNKHAKIPAFAGRLPELTHDEIAGWGQHGDVTRQIFTVVQLRHEDEHPQVMRRYELMRDLVDEVVHEIVDVEAEGDGSVAQMFDLAYFGDVVSLHLAMNEGTDPGPVPAVARVETELTD
jgi:glucose/mannose-6-phosphate isomerase